MGLSSVRRAVPIVALAVTLLSPASAYAWGNGASRSGNGFGTHDWMLLEANRLAATQGATWLDTNVALPVTDDPDTRIKDQKNHVYDRWGKRAGYADRRVSALYAQAVVQLRAGDTAGASRTTGLMSHYYTDVCNPLNTDDSPAEKRIHDRYDLAVDKRLRRVGANSAWVVYDGYQHPSSAAALTASSAKAAHGSYNTLVTTFAKRGYNASVARITARQVNRATNGLADLIVGIQEDAARISAGPDTAAHQGVATDGTHYYLVHTNWIEKYDLAWQSIDATFAPFAGIPDLEVSPQAHLGSGCYHDGKLYVVAENYPAVTNQHILVFDADTLERQRAVPTSQTHEVSAVTVASDEATHGVLYVASFFDSTRLFRYDIDTLAYLGDFKLSPPPAPGVQALAYHDGRFYLGAGDRGGIGRVYVADKTGATRLVFTSTLHGWHEGFDFLNGQLIWLVDNGFADARVWNFKLPTH